MMDGQAMEKLFDAARGSIGVTKFSDEHALALLPEGFNVRDLREMLPPPPRPQERIELLTVDSFAEYVLKFGQPSTAAFADETKAEYRAVLDYHSGPGVRGHCDHVALYKCPPSPEWKAWTQNDGKPLAQAEFARFIENNLPDMLNPSAAEMLQMAISIAVKKDASFAQDIRLANGQVQLRYEETIRGTSNAGDLTIPDHFRISIPVFLDRERQPIDCRLRYRIDGAKLVIWHEIVRRELVYLEAVRDVTKSIREKLAAIPLYVARQ